MVEMKKENVALDEKKPALAYLKKSKVKKLLLQKEKRIVVLVSVGQTYHKDSFMKATVDLLVQQIVQCRHIVENKEFYRKGYLNVDLAEGAWIINVVPADTLQIRNLIEQRYRQALIEKYKKLDDQIQDHELRKSVMTSLLKEWCKEGENYKNKATEMYQPCVEAGFGHVDGDRKQLIKVILKVLTWHELFNETVENGVLIEEDPLRSHSSMVAKYEFWDAFDSLVMAYDKERFADLVDFTQKRGITIKKERIEEACDSLRDAVNNKGLDHLNRDEERRINYIKLLRTSEQSKYVKTNNTDLLKLRDGESLPENLRNYILVEFAYLVHCLSLGCGFDDQNPEQCPTYIMYPHEEPFPALQQVKALLSLIFAYDGKSEVKHLGFGVSNNFKRDLTGYGAVGASESQNFQIDNVKQQKKKFLINLFRDLDLETSLIKEVADRKEFNLPIVDDMFVNRQEIHTKINELFKLKPTNATETREAILCLQGIGGVGKSLLALDYCHKLPHAYSLVIWISASVEKIDGLIHQLAIDLFLYEPEQSVAESALKVRKYLSETPGWLLVLDGINDEILQSEWDMSQSVSADLNFFKGEQSKKNIRKRLGFIPDYGGHVLITSQLDGWKGKGVIDVGVMESESAINLLKRRLGPQFANLDSALAALSEKLGYYPLALAHAAAYIFMEYDTVVEPSSPEDCINSFISKYESAPLDVLGSKIPSKSSVRHDSVVRTLRMLIGKLYIGKEIKTSLVRELLSVMAFLDGDAIGCDFLKVWVAQSRPLDQERLLGDLERLKHLFLITSRDENSYKMHGVVQAILLEMLLEEERQVLSDTIMKVIVKLIMAEVHDEMSWSQMANLIPHANRLLEMADKNKIKININQHRILLKKTIRFYLNLDSMAIAGRKLKELEKIANEVDPKNKEYAEIITEMLVYKASFCISSRQGAKEVVVEIEQKINTVAINLGEEHLLFQELKYNMGLLLYESERFDEALGILKHSLKTAFLKSSRIRLLNCFANIATIYHKKARVEATKLVPCADTVSALFKNAIFYFNKALEIHKSDPDPNIGYVYNGLHVVYSDQYNPERNLGEAEKCCHLSISECEKYKNRGAKVARYKGWAYNNLCHIYCEREQLDRALEYHKLFLECINTIVEKTENKTWPEAWAYARDEIIGKLEKLERKKEHEKPNIEHMQPAYQEGHPKADLYLPGLK